MEEGADGASRQAGQTPKPADRHLNLPNGTGARDGGGKLVTPSGPPQNSRTALLLFIHRRLAQLLLPHPLQPRRRHPRAREGRRESGDTFRPSVAWPAGSSPFAGGRCRSSSVLLPTLSSHVAATHGKQEEPGLGEFFTTGVRCRSRVFTCPTRTRKRGREATRTSNIHASAR
jgi:hypothetical protein